MVEEVLSVYRVKPPCAEEYLVVVTDRAGACVARPNKTGTWQDDDRIGVLDLIDPCQRFYDWWVEEIA